METEKIIPKNVTNIQNSTPSFPLTFVQTAAPVQICATPVPLWPIDPIFSQYQTRCITSINAYSIKKRTTTTASIKTADQEKLDRALNDWSQKGLYPERRHEACKRISAAAQARSAVLDLSSLFLNSLPPGLESLKLKDLNLHNNCLESISNLPKGLERLNISDNHIKILADLFLSQLEELHAQNNEISILPEKALPNLRVLNISKNTLRTLPFDFAKYFPKLELLNLNYNHLIFLKNTWPLNLTTLLAEYNQITNVDLGTLSEVWGLTRLHLRGNRIPESALKIADIFAASRGLIKNP